MKGTRVNPDGSIIFCYHHWSADSVYVAGNFSDWKGVPMERGEGGWWYLKTVPMSAGHYEYLFISDGTWTTDQFNLRRTPDGRNSSISVDANCGYLIRDSFFSPSLGKEKRYTIYLPPSYPFDLDRHYPTLYILTGLLDDDADWSRKGHIEEAMDKLLSAGAIGEMIVVSPDKDEAFENPHQWGNYTSYLSNDIISHVESGFRAISSGDARTIDGLSLGAAWSLRCGTNFPGRYSAIGSMSGMFTEELANTISRNAGELIAAGTRFRIMAESSEPEVVRNNSLAHEFIQSQGLYSEFYIKDGPHDWPIWIEDIYGALQFHYHSFKI